MPLWHNATATNALTIGRASRDESMHYSLCLLELNPSRYTLLKLGSNYTSSSVSFCCDTDDLDDMIQYLRYLRYQIRIAPLTEETNGLTSMT